MLMLQHAVAILRILWGVITHINYLVMFLFLTLFISISILLVIPLDVLGITAALTKFFSYSTYSRIHRYTCNATWVFFRRLIITSAKTADMFTIAAAAALEYVFILSASYLFMLALHEFGKYKLFLLLSLIFYIINFKFYYTLLFNLQRRCLVPLSDYSVYVKMFFSMVVTPAVYSIFKVLDTPRKLTSYKAIRIFFALVILGVVFELCLLVLIFLFKTLVLIFPISFYLCLSGLILNTIVQDLDDYYWRIAAKKNILLIILLVFITITAYTVIYYYCIDALILHVCETVRSFLYVLPELLI